MASEERVVRVCDAIEAQVAHLLGADAYRAWAEGQHLSADDLVVFNNSFLYREGIASTVKNVEHLSVVVNDRGEASLPASVVRSDSRINVRFKRIAARSSGSFESLQLREAVAGKLTKLGTIVFALVGRVAEDQPAEVDLAGVPGVVAVRFVPNQAETARIEGKALTLSRLDDIDVAWQAVEAAMGEADMDGLEELGDRFEETFVDLREAAGRPILIDDVRSDAPSILSDVVARLDDQVQAYKQALAARLERTADAEALNEALRIAYNFADGAKSLITLVVGLSDLKPLLFWLTIGAQFDLADRFSELPFALVGKAKPSLDRYRTLIAGARNRAFHDVFAFERPFNVRLGPDAIRDAELRLFREYSRRQGPALEFEDRQVVELLEGLTRVAERPVPIGFWDKNAAVMEAVGEVARAFRDALVLVAAGTE